MLQVGVQAGLFHGGKSLAEPQKTSEKTVSKDGECEWEEDLQFDILVCDIPRMARLCLVVYESSKTAKGAKFRRAKDSKQVKMQLKIIFRVFVCNFLLLLSNLLLLPFIVCLYLF